MSRNVIPVSLTGAGSYISIGNGQVITVDEITESDIADLGTTVAMTSDIGTTIQAWSAVLDATTGTFTTADQTVLDNAPTIASGAGAPGTTPTKVGDIYVDTTGDNVWQAAGTSGSGDWKQATGAGGGDLLAANNLSDVADAGTARTNLGLAIGTDVQAYSAVLAATTASFLTADETKLDNIEALADVTDATNVAAAGGAIIESGAGAPSSTPSKVGDIYIDTTGDLVYVATDTASSADWDQLGVAGSGIDSIVEDDTPQLGGDLDLNGNVITGMVIGTNIQAWSAVLDATTASFTTADETNLDAAPFISSGAGAPSSTPGKVGDIYIDTSADTVYVATDTVSSADWDQLGVSGSGIDSVAEDPTPQLGGPLDGQGEDLNNLGVVFMTEQANAEVDVPGKGQWWVRDDQTPVFTNEDGEDISLLPREPDFIGADDNTDVGGKTQDMADLQAKITELATAGRKTCVFDGTIAIEHGLLDLGTTSLVGVSKDTARLKFYDSNKAYYGHLSNDFYQYGYDGTGTAPGYPAWNTLTTDSVHSIKAGDWLLVWSDLDADEITGAVNQGGLKHHPGETVQVARVENVAGPTYKVVLAEPVIDAMTKVKFKVRSDTGYGTTVSNCTFEGATPRTGSSYEWSAGAPYVLGNYVYAQRSSDSRWRIFYCHTGHTAGAFFSTDEDLYWNDYGATSSAGQSLSFRGRGNILVDNVDFIGLTHGLNFYNAWDVNVRNVRFMDMATSSITGTSTISSTASNGMGLTSACTRVTIDGVISTTAHHHFDTGAQEEDWTDSATFTTNFAVNDDLTSSNHGLAVNDTIKLTTTDTLPGGTAADTLYYVGTKATHTFTLSTTRDNANPVSLSSDGAGTHTWNACNEHLETIHTRIGTPREILVRNWVAYEKELTGADSTATFNTHESGYGVTFENCTAYMAGQNGGAFNSRSRKTRWIDCSVWGYSGRATAAFRPRAAGSDETGGAEIINCAAYDCYWGADLTYITPHNTLIKNCRFERCRVGVLIVDDNQTVDGCTFINTQEPAGGSPFARPSCIQFAAGFTNAFIINNDFTRANNPDAEMDTVFHLNDASDADEIFLRNNSWPATGKRLQSGPDAGSLVTHTATSNPTTAIDVLANQVWEYDAILGDGTVPMTGDFDVNGHAIIGASLAPVVRNKTTGVVYTPASSSGPDHYTALEDAIGDLNPAGGDVLESINIDADDGGTQLVLNKAFTWHCTNTKISKTGDSDRMINVDLSDGGTIEIDGLELDGGEQLQDTYSWSGRNTMIGASSVPSCTLILKNCYLHDGPEAGQIANNAMLEVRTEFFYAHDCRFENPGYIAIRNKSPRVAEYNNCNISLMNGHGKQLRFMTASNAGLFEDQRITINGGTWRAGPDVVNRACVFDPQGDIHGCHTLTFNDMYFLDECTSTYLGNFKVEGYNTTATWNNCTHHGENLDRSGFFYNLSGSAWFKINSHKGISTIYPVSSCREMKVYDSKFGVGADGEAPELLTLDVAPLTGWSTDDTITGATSGCTAEVIRAMATAKKVTGATVNLATPGVVTSAGHPFYNGEKVHCYLPTDWNGCYHGFTVANRTTNSFELRNYNDTADFASTSAKSGLTIKHIRNETVAETATITGITKANPAVVTATHHFADGDIVSIRNVGGMTEVNDLTFTVANSSDGGTTFELSGINSTGYTTYTTGGTAEHQILEYKIKRRSGTYEQGEVLTNSGGSAYEADQGASYPTMEGWLYSPFQMASARKVEFLYLENTEFHGLRSTEGLYNGNSSPWKPGNRVRYKNLKMIWNKDTGEANPQFMKYFEDCSTIAGTGLFIDNINPYTQHYARLGTTPDIRLGVSCLDDTGKNLAYGARIYDRYPRVVVSAKPNPGPWQKGQTLTGETSRPINNQTAANYGDDPTTEGTFFGGSGYANGDTITLSDGTVITVDGETATVVHAFTVSSVTSDWSVKDDDTLTQSSTSGGGSGFTLTVDEDNLDSFATCRVVERKTDEIYQIDRLESKRPINVGEVLTNGTDSATVSNFFRFDRYTPGYGSTTYADVQEPANDYPGTTDAFPTIPGVFGARIHNLDEDNAESFHGWIYDGDKWVEVPSTGDFLADGTIAMTGDLIQTDTDAAGADVTTQGKLWTRNAKPRDGQDETAYDNSPVSEGTFSGGTGHNDDDIITLSDGTTVTVNDTSSGPPGPVSKFTVDSSASTGAEPDVAIAQTGSDGPGVKFSLTPGPGNLTHQSSMFTSELGIDYRLDRTVPIVEGESAADTTVRIQTVLDTYGEAILERGTYKIDTKLVMAQNYKLSGIGMSTVIEQQTLNEPVIESATGGNIWGIQITNIQLNRETGSLRPAAASNTNAIGINLLSGCYNFTITKVMLRRHVYGIKAQTGFLAHLDELDILDTRSFGIWWENGTTCKIGQVRVNNGNHDEIERPWRPSTQISYLGTDCCQRDTDSKLYNWSHNTGTGSTVSDSTAAAASFDFTDDDVDTEGGNTINETSHSLETDTPVKLSTTGVLPSPLVAGTVYWVIDFSANSIKLSATEGGGAITITSADGGGTHSLTATAWGLDRANWTRGAEITSQDPFKAYYFKYVAQINADNLYAEACISNGEYLFHFNDCSGRAQLISENNQVMRVTGSSGTNSVNCLVYAAGSLGSSMTFNIVRCQSTGFDLHHNHASAQTAFIRLSGNNYIIESLESGSSNSVWDIGTVGLGTPYKFSNSFEGCTCHVIVDNAPFFTNWEHGNFYASGAGTRIAYSGESASFFPFFENETSAATTARLAALVSGGYVSVKFDYGQTYVMDGGIELETRTTIDLNESSIEISSDSAPGTNNGVPAFSVPTDTIYAAVKNGQITYQALQPKQHATKVPAAFTVDYTTDIFTSNGHGLDDGDVIKLYAGTLPGGTSEHFNYYVRDKTTNTFKIEETIGGGAVNITSNGSGSSWKHGPFLSVAFSLEGSAQGLFLENLRVWKPYRGLSHLNDSDAWFVTAKNVAFFECGDWGVYGYSGTTFLFDNVYIASNSERGFYFRGNNTIDLRNCYVGKLRQFPAVHFNTNCNATLTNFVAENCGKYGGTGTTPVECSYWSPVMRVDGNCHVVADSILVSGSGSDIDMTNSPDGCGYVVACHSGSGATVEVGKIWVRSLDGVYGSDTAGDSLDFTAAADDWITSNGHGLYNGDPIQVTNDSEPIDLPGGLSPFTDYYVRDKTTNTFKLSPTRSPTGPVNITDTGSGTHTWKYVGASGGTLKMAYVKDTRFTNKRILINATENASDEYEAHATAGRVIEWKGGRGIQGTSDPDVNDDDTSHIEVGDRWVNTATSTEFVCTDNAEGSAVWEVTAGAKVYGEIRAETNATTTTFPGQSTDFSNASKVTVFTVDGLGVNCDPDNTSDDITIEIDGDYELTADVSFSGAANEKCSFAFFKNGNTKLGGRATRKLGTGGDVGAFAFHTLASLVATDTVGLWVQNETLSPSAITVEDCTLIVKKLS